jgi:excisionase family DNA binding protein
MDTLKPLFVRPVEAARLLGVSRSKLYELVRAGAIPSRKFGSSIRIPLEALERMAQE